MRHAIACALGMLLVLSGCAASPTAAEITPSTPAPGSDRDAHGCIPSAGYQWCPATQRCERSWELAREKGFDASVEGFASYCRIEQNQK